MHALARLAIFRLQERGVPPDTTFRAVRLLDEASLEVCEGRFRDLEAQERIDLDVEGYLKIASSKTGALYSCAMKLGSVAAGADGLLIEVHHRPEEALCDAAQALTPPMFTDLMGRLRPLCAFMDSLPG